LTHTHTQVTIASSTDGHIHVRASTDKDCGSGSSHNHNVNTLSGGSHQHGTVVLDFANSPLGSPWWNHTHQIILTSMDSQGANHRHTTESTSQPFGCDQCIPPMIHAHSHTLTPINTAYSSFAHTLTGIYTQTADPAGTPENHVHPFSFSFDYAGNHYHPCNAPALNTQTCYYGYAHTHAAQTGGGTNYVTHTHSGSGNSGSGGEPPPAVAAQPVGDGLTFAS